MPTISSTDDKGRLNKGAFTQSAVTDGTALDRSQSRNWLDFESGRERFRPSPHVQPQINKRVAAERAASGA